VSNAVKDLRRRDPELAKGCGQIATPLRVEAAGGAQRVNCANTEGLFRTIQSSPSPKAEPFVANRSSAKQAGTIAGNARKALEENTGKKVVSKTNYLTTTATPDLLEAPETAAVQSNKKKSK
jgi:hypothetical protein